MASAKLFFLVVTLLSVFQTGFTRSVVSNSGNFWESPNQAATVAKFTKLVTSLQLGDACSWKAESMRLAFTRAYLNSDMYALGKWMQKIAMNNKPLCNANQLTVCSKLTQTCICGEPYLALSKTTQKYVAENGTCRWAEKSACVLEDFSKQIQARTRIDLHLNSKCQAGTTCRTGSNRQICTTPNLILEFLKSGHITTNQTVIIETIYSGRICNCQPNHANSEEDADSSEEAFEFLNDLIQDNLHGRSKREISKMELMTLLPPYVNL